MIKILHVARDAIKTLRKKGEMKENYEKRLTTSIKSFTFIFVYVVERHCSYRSALVL